MKNARPEIAHYPRLWRSRAGWGNLTHSGDSMAESWPQSGGAKGQIFSNKFLAHAQVSHSLLSRSDWFIS